MGNYVYCCHPMFQDIDDDGKVLRRFDGQQVAPKKKVEFVVPPKPVLSPPPKDWEFCESPVANDVKEEGRVGGYDAASAL